MLKKSCVKAAIQIQNFATILQFLDNVSTGKKGFQEVCTNARVLDNRRTSVIGHRGQAAF